MSEFDDLVKKAGKTAKTAAKKTGELYESAKLNWKIATEEEKMKDIFVKMGKLYYAEYDSSACEDSEMRELCEQVSEVEVTLRNLNRKLRQYKKIVRCPKCGKEFKDNTIFCPACGSKV